MNPSSPLFPLPILEMLSTNRIGSIHGPHSTEDDPALTWECVIDRPERYTHFCRNGTQSFSMTVIVHQTVVVCHKRHIHHVAHRR